MFKLLSKPIYISSLIFLAAASGFAQLPDPCALRNAPSVTTMPQVRALFTDVPTVELGAAAANVGTDISDARDSIWASSGGVARLHSAAYAGRPGTAAAGLYLYLYDVVSLGGNVSTPTFAIPLGYATLDSTLLGTGGSVFIKGFLQIAAGPDGRLDAAAFPNSDAQEPFTAVSTSWNFALFYGDYTGISRSSVPIGFITARRPAAGFGLATSAVSFGPRVVAAVIPSTSFASKLVLSQIRSRAAELRTSADIVDSYLAGSRRTSSVLNQLSRARASASGILERAGADDADGQFLDMLVTDATAAFDAVMRQIDSPVLNLAILNLRTLGGADRDTEIAQEAPQSQSLLTQLRIVQTQTAALQEPIMRLLETDSVASPSLIQAQLQLFQAASLLGNVSLQLRQLELAPVLPPPISGCLADYDLFAARPAVTPQDNLAWTLTPGAGTSTGTQISSPLTAGYAKLQPSAGISPFAWNLISLTQNGVHVSETAMTASPAIRNARFHAVRTNDVNTGIAIVNANSLEVAIAFTATSSDGVVIQRGSLLIAPNRHIGVFIDQNPFAVAAPFDGTVTLAASAPIGIAALRSRTNERAESLISAIPVTDLDTTVDPAAIIPQYVTGGGWTSDIVLMNPTSQTIRGTIDLRSGTGEASDVAYTVGPSGVQVLRVGAVGGSLQTGYVRIRPSSGDRPPSASVSVSLQRGNIAISEHTVEAAAPGTDFRIFTGSAAPTSVVFTNSSTLPIAVQYELLTLAGISSGFRGTVNIAPNSQMPVFVSELPGFEFLPTSYQGVLKVASATLLSSIYVAAFRTQYNERGDFIMTTLPVENANNVASTSETILPQLVFGGVTSGVWYSTQFILINGAGAAPSAGTLRFFSDSGGPLSIQLR